MDLKKQTFSFLCNELLDIAQPKMTVAGRLLCIGQEQSNSYAPLDFYYLPVVGKRAGRQHRADPLGNFERVGGQSPFVSSLKEMDTDVFLSFALG